VAEAAWQIVEAEGVDALTMRRLAEDLGIRAPSLYKHFPDKAALEHVLIARGLREMGAALHAAISGRTGAGRNRVASLLRAYRREAAAHPNLYRLATSGPLPRAALPPGLEAWAGEPFFLVTADERRAQALWAFAHGMVILEIDDRFPAGSDLERTWRAGAAAFTRAG
jgi:AcrR family transcriptional regulator